MKTISLDIGDIWTGVAISDPLGILARPYDTVHSSRLCSFINELLTKERISIVVVGLPTTLRGTQSEQTKKIITLTEELQKTFPSLVWKLWDERFTSKQASTIKHAKTKKDKLHSHAIAAALILSGYLEYQRIHSAHDQNSY